MRIFVVLPLILILTTGCVASNFKEIAPVEIASHSRGGLVNIDLRLRAGVSNLWDGNSLFKIYVRDVDRLGESATHVIEMCGIQQACILRGIKSEGFFDEELFRGSVIIAGNSATIEIPAELLPQSFYVWRTSGRGNIREITFGMGHVVSEKIN